MEIKRYKTEQEAVNNAKALSLTHGDFSVIESPHREDPDAGRFVVEEGDGGFVRSWERHVAVFHKGKKRRNA